jgi:hypothetical protein
MIMKDVDSGMHTTKKHKEIRRDASKKRWVCASLGYQEVTFSPRNIFINKQLRDSVDER